MDQRDHAGGRYYRPIGQPTRSLRPCGQLGHALSMRNLVPCAVQRRNRQRSLVPLTRASASRATASASGPKEMAWRRSRRCLITIAYSRLPATSDERLRASASSVMRGRMPLSSRFGEKRNGHTSHRDRCTGLASGAAIWPNVGVLPR
jgi:hypothetical protein